MKRFHLLALSAVLMAALPATSMAREIYKVKKGDSLYKISKTFQVDLEAIREANDISGDDLRPGTQLTIPDRSAQPAVGEGRGTPQEAGGIANDRGMSLRRPTFHTVQKGDTLDAIARKYSLPLQELRRLNGLQKNAKLKAGVSLRLVEAPPSATADRIAEEPQSSKTPTGTAVAKAKSVGGDGQPARPAAISTNPTTGARVEVKSGDSLSSIARRYSLSTAELRALNGLKKNAKLRPGTTLVIRSAEARTYVVRKGDTLWQIGQRFGRRTEDLARINGLGRQGLKAGQKLYLDDVSAGRQAGVASAEPAECRIDEEKVYEELRALSEVDQEDPEPVTAKDRVIRVAQRMLDIPYRFGGTTLRGIDCSAYVQKVFRFLNIPLPRTAREQFHHGEDVTRDELATGDLVFFRTYARFPSHVGIYLGNNQFIHASSVDKKVTIDSLETPYYSKRFIGGRRLVHEAPPQQTADKPTGDGVTG